MPINPNIILGLRQGEYKAPDPLEQYGKAQTLKALITQGDVQDLQAQQLRQGIEDDQAVRQAHITAAGDPNRLRSILQSGGQFKALRELDKADLEKRAKEATIGKDEADAKKKAFDVSISRLQHGAAVLGTATDQASYDTALKIMARDFGPEAVQGMSPTFNPQEVQASIARGLTRAQQLEDQRKVEEAKERNRHNLQAERASMISAGAAASNAQTARDRLEYDKSQPKGTFSPELGVIVDTRAGTATPVLGPDGKPIGPKDKDPNEAQGKAILFGSRMSASDNILKGLEKKGVTTGSIIKQGAESLPVVGGAAGMAANFLSSGDQQLVEQAQRDFINAILRRESGAVIADSEFANARRQYFGQPGDSAETLAQKQANRALAIEGMKTEAGRHAPAIAKNVAATRPPSRGSEGTITGPTQSDIDAELRRRGVKP